MAATQSSRVASLILRIFTFVPLLVFLVVLATNSIGKARFTANFYAYRYMLAAIVIGLAYSFLQLVLSLFTITGSGEGMPVLDFFGDKIVPYLPATGAACGFGLTVDLKRILDADDVDKLSFDDKAFASASLPPHCTCHLSPRVHHLLRLLTSKDC